VIEVHDVIVQRVADEDDVADQLSVEWHAETESVLDRAHRRESMHRCTHAAEALSEDPGLARIAPAQDGLDAAPHGATCPGFADGAAIDFRVDTQMAFDAGHRID
jgi:hypothetical protein